MQATVCRAISSSSFVGMTRTFTGIPSRWISRGIEDARSVRRCRRRRSRAATAPRTTAAALRRRSRRSLRRTPARRPCREWRRRRRCISGPGRLYMSIASAADGSPAAALRCISRMSFVPADPFQPALLVQQGQEFHGIFPGHRPEEEGDRGVEVAAAGPHDQSLQRGHPHRRVDALSLPDRGRARAVPQMEGDQVQGLRRVAEEFGGAPGDVGVRGPVEAVAAHAMDVVKIAREGVAEGVGRHRLVESGVEDRHLRHPRERRECGLDPLEVAGVLQRGEGDHLPDRLEDPGIHPRRFPEPLPAVDDPVADAEEAGRVPDRSRVREVGHHPPEAFPVIPDRGGTGLADPVHDADVQRLHRFQPEEPVLDRRAPGVQDQHLQGGILLPADSVARPATPGNVPL